MTAPPAPPPERTDRELHLATRSFAHDDAGRSWAHVASTFLALTAALTAAALAPWWPVRLAASLLGALTMVRAFILYHDFQHGAILARSRFARALFNLHGSLILVPPRSWRSSHNFHHANVGTIAGSSVGSFPLMTTRMWREASPLQRLGYRLVRHPATIACAYLTIFLFSVCLLPLLRRPARHWDSAVSLLAHGAAIAALWALGGFDVAFFAMILPVAVSGALGGYLFYAQHSYPGMQVLTPQEWTQHRAALVSSSFLRVPRGLRWFVGNIGFHHVHHLNPLIPFYELPQAMAAIPELQHPASTSLRPRDVLACFRANVWDEAARRLVRYRDGPLAA